MKGDDQYTPQHDRVTRLVSAYREHTDRLINAHLTQNTDSATPDTRDHTHIMDPPQPQQQQQAPPTGDVTQVSIEKFNGTSGISVGDFIRNVEAD